MFKSYPSISDTCFYMSLVLMHPEIIKYSPNVFVSATAMMYCCVLGPLFYDLWVVTGSGNANFFYAITLVFALAQIVFIVDFMFGYVRRQWERLNPGWRVLCVDVVHK